MRQLRHIGLFAGVLLSIGLQGFGTRTTGISQPSVAMPSAPMPAPDTPQARFSLPPLRIIGKTPQRLQEASAAYKDRPYPEWVRHVAQKWQGIPYGSGGKGLGPEELLLNLDQMDCMTAVENLLAIHIARRSGDLSLESFAQALLTLRYEATPPCRWEDRYHYLTHAFLRWEKWGSWLPLGHPDPRPITYISQNRPKYAGFRDWKHIQRIEELLSSRPRFYIPTDELQAWLPALRDGDFIAFISTEPGLDVSHVGVFFWEGEKPTFAHAALRERKWVYGEDLCAYLDRRRAKVSGITVFRPHP